MSKPDNYIVFDLEAACWRGHPPNGKQMEIIEIGAVKYNRNMEKVSEFQAFIKPETCPVLSTFCKELTHIRQEDINSAESYPTIIEEFKQWITDNGTKKYLLLSWGRYDKNQLAKDCVLHNLEHTWVKYHVNIKNKFSRVAGKKKPGLTNALKVLGLTFEGTQHRGIDDARNIGRIFEIDHVAMLSKTKTKFETAVDKVFDILTNMAEDKFKEAIEVHKHGDIAFILERERIRREQK